MGVRSRQIWLCPSSARLLAPILLFGLTACEPKLRSDNTETAVEPRRATEAKAPTDALLSFIAGASPAPVVASSAIPQRRSIKNQAGVTLSGEILAKSGDELAFRRDLDGKMFLIELGSLSPDDQLALYELPDASPELVDSLRPAPAGAAKENKRIPMVTELQSHGTFAEAQAAAKASGRHLLLIVTGEPDEVTDNMDASAPVAVMNPAATRKACQSLIRTVLGDRSFAGYVSERYEYYYLDRIGAGGIGAPDQDQGHRILLDYGINEYPTILLLSPDAQEIGRLVGYDGKGPSRVMAKLEDIYGNSLDGKPN
jgi:hypothetical protein